MILKFKIPNFWKKNDKKNWNIRKFRIFYFFNFWKIEKFPPFPIFSQLFSENKIPKKLTSCLNASLIIRIISSLAAFRFRSLLASNSRWSRLSPFLGSLPGGTCVPRTLIPTSASSATLPTESREHIFQRTCCGKSLMSHSSSKYSQASSCCCVGAASPAKINYFDLKIIQVILRRYCRETHYKLIIWFKKFVKPWKKFFFQFLIFQKTIFFNFLIFFPVFPIFKISNVTFTWLVFPKIKMLSKSKISVCFHFSNSQNFQKKFFLSIFRIFREFR